ncbi:unnamed protein product [Owenia fusiformis]|uniref:Arsenite methyltransferase n=1 Tax=Owenia fusiformis TaxID=6347 RepID=A0A8J1TI96_OWEFU|nr:unnamed protein product [Owenia fusiformis]
MAEELVTDSVKDYYGKVLSKTDDLKTNACVSIEGSAKIAKHIRKAIAQVHDEVVIKYYGCGLCIPTTLEDMSILDLGSGSGRDCYILSKLVGKNGHVVGIDMTDEQLEVANKYIDYHREKFGFAKSNVEFVKGYIEKLGEAGLKDNTFDIIVSNCVINLSPDKHAVIAEAYRVLKEGGELYFSDVYADRELSDDIRKHKVLWGECIAGALYWKDFVDISKKVGFSRPRLVEAGIIEVTKPELKEVLGDAKFVSVTYRMFKLPKTEKPASQVIYEGNIEDSEKEFKLDYNHIFCAGDVVSVDSDISTILQCSRLADEFTFQPSAVKGGASCSPKEEDIVDPFEYLAKGGPSKGACCAPSDNSKGGCC